MHDGGDLSRDLDILQNADTPRSLDGLDDDDEKGVTIFYDGDDDDHQRQGTVTTDIDYADGYGIDDLLNGYVVDEETMSAVDDALITIITEWSTIDELTGNGRDIKRYHALMESKCPDAHSVLKDKLTDSPREIHEIMMRNARWILKTSLVLKNEKMVYVPVKFTAE